MAEERVQRKLAAILAADVVGYSRRMGADEEGTLAALLSHRRELIEPAIAKYQGRVFKTTGDGVLAEFASVVDAVGCAVAIQEGIGERNAGTPEDRRIEFRIGINLGDVIVEDGDVFGDGVNVAARLEGLAEPGGVIVSGSVHEQVRNKLDLGFEDLGRQEVKNIAEPVYAFAVRGLGTAAQIAVAANTPREKPSIAVLPFDNMSGDPEQEYFADGISEDIITAQSKMRWFFVVARNSTFAFKGQALDVKEVARELGVDYVLEGSVRKSGNRVRITTQLIDAATGNHVLADRYDRELEDVFALQDEITETVAATLEPALYAAESERAQRKPPQSLDAWDHVMRAMPHLWRFTGEDIATAQKYLNEAIAVDPNYAQAHSMLAFSYIWHVWMSWGEVGGNALELANESARKSVDLDETDPWAHVVLGMVFAYGRRREDALAEVQKSLDLNPSFAFGHACLGLVFAYGGEPDQALVEVREALRMSPRDPLNALYHGIESVAYFAARDFEKSLESARNGIRERPEYVGAWRMTVIALSQLNRLDEARAALEEVKRFQPSISLKWAREFAPWTRQADLDLYVESFRRAGLTE